MSHVIPYMWKPFFLFIPILIIQACSEEKPIDDSIKCIGFVNHQKEITIDTDNGIVIPSFNMFIFLYHDSIFHVEYNKAEERICYSVEYTPKLRNYVDSIFKQIDYKEHQIPLNEYVGSCASDVIYLNSDNGQHIFTGLSFSEVFPFVRYRNEYKRKQVSLPSVLEAKLFELEGRYMEHYFSDDYYYKDLRIRSNPKQL